MDAIVGMFTGGGARTAPASRSGRSGKKGHQQAASTQATGPLMAVGAVVVFVLLLFVARAAGFKFWGSSTVRSSLATASPADKPAAASAGKAAAPAAAPRMNEVILEDASAQSSSGARSTAAVAGGGGSDGGLVTWADVLQQKDAVVTAAKLLFGPVETDLCMKKWLPQSSMEWGSGWPVCFDAPLPPPNRCIMYSAGIHPSMRVEVAAAHEISCNVRAFDGSRRPVDGIPSWVHYHPVSLASDNDLDAKPPVATLSTLQGLEFEQGRATYILKLDCDGCEWGSFAQQLEDLGPRALRDYDIIMMRANMKAGLASKEAVRNMGAAAALLNNLHFRLYFRRLPLFGDAPLAGVSGPPSPPEQAMLTLLDNVAGGALAAASGGGGGGGKPAKGAGLAALMKEAVRIGQPGGVMPSDAVMGKAPPAQPRPAGDTSGAPTRTTLLGLGDIPDAALLGSWDFAFVRDGALPPDKSLTGNFFSIDACNL